MRAPGPAVGTAESHHGELLQGALQSDEGVVRCLITMPFRHIGSVVRYTPIDGHPLEVSPAWKTKAARAARLTLAQIGRPAQGLLQIECALQVGLGRGSSTADVVAAIRAVCAGYGETLEPQSIARIAVAAESAVDPIMFEDEMVVFAQRQGIVLESLGRWLPAFDVLSLDMEPGSGGIDTLGVPLPEYTERELAYLEDLLAQARQAFRRNDRTAIAQLATESARLNQRFLPMERFAKICRVAQCHGALGVQISHSGTLAGVLFEPELIARDGHIVERISTEVESFGARVLGKFVTGDG
jgi:uncharacterized protein involved in propanediol utilization